MTKTGVIAGSLLLVLALPARAEAPPFDSASRVSDADLATMRGGFAVQGGVEISLAVQMDAAVNGALVLRTVFRVDQNTPTLAVYAPAPGTTGPAFAAPRSIVAGTSGATAPIIVWSGQNGVTTLQPGATVPANIAVSTTGNPAIGNAPAGLSVLPVTVGGPAVQTAGGQLMLISVANGTSIVLNGGQTTVNQIVGEAFLNSVQNSANNRQIDTATTINVGLANTAATVAASAAARVADLASQVSLRLAR